MSFDYEWDILMSILHCFVTMETKVLLIARNDQKLKRELDFLS